MLRGVGHDVRAARVLKAASDSARRSCTQLSNAPSGLAAWVWSQASTHCPHCTQANIMRLTLRGLRRIGQTWSQAELQLAQSWARSRLKPITMALSLPIQARLWNRPTAQP